MIVGLEVLPNDKPKEDFDLPEGVPAILAGIIDQLVAIDRMLAEDARSEFPLFPLNEKVMKEIAKSDKEMLKALGHLPNEPDKAIDHYKKAWEHAQHALKYTP